MFGFVASLYKFVGKFVCHFFEACVFVVRYLCVSPVAIAFLQLSGWYDVLWTYSCLLVGFMFVLTSRSHVSWNLGPLYTVVSRKVSSSVLCSCVNFMVWCTLLIFSMKVSRALSVSVHTMKISSMNLFHISMALLFNLISLGSSSPMNRLA